MKLFEILCISLIYHNAWVDLSKHVSHPQTIRQPGGSDAISMRPYAAAMHSMNLFIKTCIYCMHETPLEQSGVFQYFHVAPCYLYGALFSVHAQLCDMYHPIQYPVCIRFWPSHIEALNWCNSHPWSWLLMCRSSHRQSSLQQLFPPIPFPGRLSLLPSKGRNNIQACLFFNTIHEIALRIHRP